MVYYIAWFANIEPSLHSWNLTWSWYIILLMYYWIWFTNILLRIFTSIIIKDIGLNFFFGTVFFWFWYQGDCGFIEWIWKCSLFFARVRGIGISSSLYVWCNSLVKLFNPGILFAGNILLLEIQFHYYWSVCSKCLFLFGKLHLSRSLSISSRLSSFFWHITVHTILLWLFASLWYWLLFLLFQFLFCLFRSSFFSSRWAWLKVYEFCLSFQKVSSWFYWPFPFFFFFLAFILLISSQVFIIFFLLLTLGLVSSSFSNFFR